MRRLVLILLVASIPRAARAAVMDYPIAVVASPDGTVYIADRYLPGVWTFKDGKQELYFEGSKKFRTPLNAVRCLAVDADGRLLAGDSATRQVYRFDESAHPVPLLKGPVGLGIPMALAVGKGGAIHVADLETQRIWKVPGEGGEPAEVAEIPGIRSLTIDADDRLWVVTNTANAIVRIADGKQETILRERTFSYPQHILLDKQGNALVSDSYAKTIWKIAPDGTAEKHLADGALQYPVGIAWNGDSLLITDSRARTVFTADSAGKISRLLPEPPKK